MHIRPSQALLLLKQYSVPSVTDLTGLGLALSKCLEVAGERTDVFLDSLNPLLAALRVDYLLNFLQSTAARVKAKGGRFYASVGLGIDKSDMTKLEEASDCVIETQVQDTKNGQRRRMRIKKLRGQSYDDKWTHYSGRLEKGNRISVQKQARISVDLVFFGAVFTRSSHYKSR